MSKVFCVGELLIDFVCKDIGTSLVEGVSFEKKAGGAPANVAAAVTKLGGEAFFMGKVGEDAFGQFLKNVLEGENIQTSMLEMGGNTTLAFVSIDKSGERDFTFHRNADGDYDFANIDTSIMKKGDILHFGSATAFLEGKLKDTYFKLLSFAKENELFISFDPNYRDALITDCDAFRRECKKFIEVADFMKVSDEEAMLLTQKETLRESLEVLQTWGAKVICVTLGKEGTLLVAGDKETTIPSIKINQVDSTGAGDAFVGATLYQYATNSLTPSWEELQAYIELSNRVGAITCENYGAIVAIPTLEEARNR